MKFRPNQKWEQETHTHTHTPNCVSTTIKIAWGLNGVENVASFEKFLLNYQSLFLLLANI